jgi:transcriptional regulator with XRE-family HTH domain
MWLGAEGEGGARNSPRHLDDVIVLSAGLAVSVDWLIFGSRLYPCRDWVEPTMGRRLRRCIDERYERLSEFRERLGVTPNMLRRWTRSTARPELYYLRHSAAMLGVSLDWLARGEPWEDTLRRYEYSPAEVSTQLAVRALERMARRSVDPGVAHGLQCAAKRAGALPRPRVIEEQATLPFGE